MRATALLVLCAVVTCTAVAQQTVFSVPSADVLDRGNIYGEFDATYQHSSDAATFAPRVVIGIGHRIEVGLNANGFGIPGKQSFTPAPTVKWKIYQGKRWSWLVGDDVFIPVQHRAYDVGNYVWSEAAYAWENGTRFTLGAYHVTSSVVGAKQKAGGQFALERPLTSRVSVAADWFTGDSTIGYVTPGVILKLSRNLTWYGAYQIGNHDLSGGNHQLLFEVGWNLK